MDKQILLMNTYLSNLNVLYRKIQNFHWYITGPNFFVIHEKLEEIYNKISGQIDDIAERILALGDKPFGSMKKYLEYTSIKENEDLFIDTKSAITSVIQDFEHIVSDIKLIKEETDKNLDYGTSAMLDEHILYYEKLIWMLNAVKK